MKKLLSTTFQGANWPDVKEKDRVKGWIKDIGTRVKERMVEIQPRGL
jgi:tctex1 domain-containing protein 2